MSGRFIYARPVSIIVGDQNVTGNVQSCSFSNVDPGGFEACQISLSNPVKAPRAGERITIRYGLEVAWDGRVNDPGNANTSESEVEAITGVGFGAALKDQTMREIYRDIDLGRWQGPSVQRQLNILGSSIDLNAGQVTADAATGEPSLALELRSPWSRTAQCEAWYDAQGLGIGSVYYAWKVDTLISAADTNWSWNLYTADDDVATNLNGTANLRAAGPGSGTHTASAGHKAAYVRLLYNVAVTSDSNVARRLYWTRLAAMGTHGLTLRGTEPDAGFYPTDIALHALADYNALTDVEPIDQGPVDTDSNAYAVPHATYLTDTPHEQIIDDMIRKQLGWHWGVWEPAGLHSTTPRLFLTKPPESATAHAARAELGDDFDAPRVRLDSLYDTANVAYTDASGRQNIVTVTIDNPLLDQAGVGSRTLTLNAGPSTSAAATTYGTFALNLAFAAARGAGSATLPDTVGTTTGRKPACLLRAGRDRLRITDMPDPGPLHESDTRRYDTFHVRRVETTISQDGVPRTRVELGTGADLMEVLNARTASALVNLT